MNFIRLTDANAKTVVFLCAARIEAVRVADGVTHVETTSNTFEVEETQEAVMEQILQVTAYMKGPITAAQATGRFAGEAANV